MGVDGAFSLIISLVPYKEAINRTCLKIAANLNGIAILTKVLEKRPKIWRDSALRFHHKCFFF